MTNSAKSDLMLVGVTLLAAVSWIMSREAVLLMPPLLFMGFRFLLAAMLLAVIGFRQLRTMGFYALKRSINVGIVFAIAMSFWVMGIFTGTHVGEGAFLTSLGVVLVPVMGRVFFNEVQVLSNWLALPVAGIGLALLSLQHGFHLELGQVFYLTAAVIFALFFRLNTQAVNPLTLISDDGREVQLSGVPAIALTSIVLAMVGIVTSILSLVFEQWQEALRHFSPAMAGWIIASAVIGTSARFLLQTYAQSLSSHTHSVVIMVVEPVWVALFAAAWYGESMSGQQLLGCAFILLALLISRASILRYWLKSLF